MADPIKKPLTWSKAYPAYAEKHDMYRVLQELLKELIIHKPDDPLAFIRDELPKIAKHIHVPRVFIIGPNIVTQGIARFLAYKCGAKYLTLADIIDEAPGPVRDTLSAYIKDDDKKSDDDVRKLLVATIKYRLGKPDCQEHGYVLYGFPRCKPQALCAQQSGLLPRQVFILYPEPARTSNVSIVATNSGTRPTLRNSTFQTGVTASLTAVAVTETSSDTQLTDLDAVTSKEVADSFDYEICMVIPYEKWSSTLKNDIEAELLSNIISIKPCGSPWIPKILLLGPPLSGRTTVAQTLSEKFSFIDVDFMELVRGASSLEDDLGKACKNFLHDLQPLNDDFLKLLLKRRMYSIDCQRKGWILHGFPQSARQLKILEILHLNPNRIFLLSCPETVCLERLEVKRKEVIERKLTEKASVPTIEEKNFELFLYGKGAFRTLYDMFSSNLNDLTSYFGNQVIYVDAKAKMQTVSAFVEAGVRKPPTVRFPDPCG